MKILSFVKLKNVMNKSISSILLENKLIDIPTSSTEVKDDYYIQVKKQLKSYLNLM